MLLLYEPSKRIFDFYLALYFYSIYFLEQEIFIDYQFIYWLLPKPIKKTQFIFDQFLYLQVRGDTRKWGGQLNKDLYCRT